MSRQSLLNSFGIATFMLSAPLFAGPGPGTTTVGIEELRDLCQQHLHHEQLKPGKVLFKCRKQKDFWVHTGTKAVCLPNEGSLCVKAYIKGQKHNTDWWSIPYGVANQAGQCEEYEQWTAVTLFSEPGSCDLLEKITQLGSEESYCEARMREEGILDNLDNTIQQVQQHPDQYQSIQAGSTVSILEKTGAIRACDSVCPAPAPAPTSSSSVVPVPTSSSTPSYTSVSTPSVSSVSSESVSATSISSSDVGYDAHTCYDLLGADVRVVTVKAGLMSKRAIVVYNAPKEGSKLYRLGLQQNDRIRRINGKKIKTVADLQRALNHTQGHVTVKLIRNGRPQVISVQQF